MNEEYTRIVSSVERAVSEKPAPELVCFDVFDTLLTRTLGEPRSLFLSLGETLHAKSKLSQSPSRFARARAGAEQRARKNVSAPADVTLAQIYRELLYAWPEVGVSLEELIDAELEAERQALRVVPYAKQLLATARAHSARIAFVSDMYLPTEFIRNELANHGLAQEEDFVYVSCDCGFRKWPKGELFRFVLEDQRLEASRALHIGDNPKADYEAARSIGIQAVALEYTHLNRYESALETNAWESGGLASAFAGASRLTRLRHLGDEQPDAMLRVLAGVGGPLLAGFTIWLLGRAKASGLRRLYFLSREGEVLFELADLLNKRMNLGMDLRYLFVSRQSINLAVLTEPSRTNLDWSLTHAGTHRLRGILERVGLRPEDVESELAGVGLPRERWDTRVNDEEYSNLVQMLGSGSAREMLSCRAAATRAVIESYLEDNGFFEDQDIGLVDTTGTGSQMRTLNVLRSGRSAAGTEGFLIYRTWKPHLQETDFPHIHTYLADAKNRRGLTYAPGLIQMLEVFASTDHGTVVGYETLDHGVKPKFANTDTSIHRFCSLRALRAPLHTFTRELTIHPRLLREHKDARSGIMEAFSLFWNHPTPDEAVYWGAFPFETGAGRETSYHALAPPLRLTDLARKALRKPIPGFAWYTWGPATEYRSPAYIQQLLRAFRFVKSKTRRVRRFFVR